MQKNFLSLDLKSIIAVQLSMARELTHSFSLIIILFIKTIKPHANSIEQYNLPCLCTELRPASLEKMSLCNCC